MVRLGLCQIDCRLGDIDLFQHLASRQFDIAHEQGVDLLCFPAPLLTGASPYSVVDAPDFERDLIVMLSSLASQAEALDLVALIPAAVSMDGSPVLEVFMLRRGRVIPLRLSVFHRLEGSTREPWGAPIFDLGGSRVLVSFDLDRDLGHLPVGMDLAICFQIDGFCRSDTLNSGIAAVTDGSFAKYAKESGMWVAYMAPIGGFDETSYIGGSFILDDEGRPVSIAPVFDEGLLVHDIDRGLDCEAPAIDAPVFDRDEWTWQALRLNLRDSFESSGHSRVAINLRGDLTSSALAALAIDALGTRRVIGVLIASEDLADPREVSMQEERLAQVRSFSRGLQIRVVERSVSDGGSLVDSDFPQHRYHGLEQAIEGLCFEDTARELDAMALSDLTKTQYALAAGVSAYGEPGVVAPFGDLFLSDLEFVIRHRNRDSTIVPARWASLQGVSSQMLDIIDRAVSIIGDEEDRSRRARQMLEMLDPSEIDEMLRAHVERNLSFGDIPGGKRHPEALALLLFIVKLGERARRRLPMAPIVSARSFAERTWPCMLGWSDTGSHDGIVPSIDELAREEAERADKRGGAHADRMKQDFIGLLGSLFGVSPDRIALGLPDRDEGDDDGQDDSQADDAASDADDGSPSQPMGPFEGGSSPFFSQN